MHRCREHRSARCAAAPPALAARRPRASASSISRQLRAAIFRTLDERGIRSGLTLPALRECADETAMQLRKGSTPSLCHNDVHHLNIVDGASLRLIDWEYAGVGEPLFDLASLCVYHRYEGRSASDCCPPTLLPPKQSAGIAWNWRAGCSTTFATCGSPLTSATATGSD